MPGGFLGLEENPFSEGHDARFLYPSHAHWEAVTRLRRAIEDREPFVYLTGPAGCGKTTALLEFLAGLESQTTVVIAATPSLTRVEVLQQLHSRLGIESPGISTPERLAERVEAQLREMQARGDVVILVVDESQNLRSESLEELMALSDLETSGRKLLQVILAGRPVLERLLSRPGCEALRPRITARCWLGAFSAEETEGYILHRVSVVSGASRSLFASDSCQAIYRLTHGNPRDINQLASEALRQAEAAGASTVRPGHIDAAARIIGLVGLLGETWSARPGLPSSPSGTGSRIVAGPLPSETPESRANHAPDQGCPPPSPPQSSRTRRRALSGPETTRDAHPWTTMAWAAGALLIVTVGFVLSVVNRNLSRGGAAHRPASAIPAVETNAARVSSAPGGVSSAGSVTAAVPNASPARTSAVTPRPAVAPRPLGPAAWTQPAAAVPKAAYDTPAPRAPAQRYGIEVATFIVESRAVEERDRLAKSIPVGCWVVTSLEDDAQVYHVLVGSLTSRSEAESLGADLSERGLVGEARVVRWAEAESTRR